MTRSPSPYTLLIRIFICGAALTFFNSSSQAQRPILLDCNQHNDPFFHGGSDGNAIIRVSNGTPPYTISWTGPVSNVGILDTNGVFRIDSLSAGNYEISVAASDGGLETCSFTLNDLECDLTLDLIAVPTHCPGTATGTFAYTFGGNTYGSLDIAWSGQESTPLLPFWHNTFGTTQIAAGTYSVTITNFRQCTLSDTITVEDAIPLALNCSSIQLPTGPGTSDGRITPLLSGGKLPYTLRWEGPVSGSRLIENPTGFVLDNLPAGSYELELIDDYGCTVYCTALLDNPANCNDFVVTLAPTPPDCHGNSTGAIEISLTGGTGPFTFDWSDDAYDSLGQNGVLSDLPAAFYQLTVTDASGCRAAASALVEEPVQLSISCTDPNFPTGPDTANGEFNLHISSISLRPYTITYSNGQETKIADARPSLLAEVYQIDSLAEGIYQVTVTDRNGCQAECQVDMNIPGCEKKLVTNITGFSSCYGESDGEINLQVREGVPEDYTFDWEQDIFDGQHHLTGLPAGDYPVTITDQNGCVDIRSIYVLDPAPLVLICNDTISPGSPGAADGQNLLRLFGGTPPYQLSWTGPVNGSRAGLTPGQFLLEALPAGEYVLNMTDNNGCTTDCSFFINDPAPPCGLSLNCRANGIGEGQGPGSYVFDISGGSPLYKLVLSGPVQFNVDLDTDGSWESGVLAAGDWTFSVTDLQGCTESCTFTVEPPDCDLQVNVYSVGESCKGSNDGYIDVAIINGTAPYEFEWSNGSETLDQKGLRPGVYEITVTDAQNCEISTLIFMAAGRALPDIVSAGPGTSICHNSCEVIPLELSGTRPFVLEYSIFQNGQVTNYEAEIDSNHHELWICPEDLGLSPGSFLLNFNYLSDRRCSQEIGLVRSFSYLEPVSSVLNVNECIQDSIRIHNILFTPDNPSQTIVFPNATANGCDSLVWVDVPFLSDTTFIEPVICPEDSFSIHGQVFDRDNPEGIVILDGSNRFGCDSIIQVSLQLLPPAITVISSDLCAGDSLVVGNEKFDQNRPSGEVIFPSSAATGCDSIVQVYLTFANPVPHLIEETLCFGDSLLINGQVFDAGRPQGTVNLQSANGCDSTIQVKLDFYPEQQVHFTGDTTVCTGSEVTIGLRVSPVFEYDYRIRSTSGTILENRQMGDLLLPVQPLQSDTFILEVITPTGGCPVHPLKDSVIIQVNKPQAEIRPLQDYHGFGVSCADAQDGSVEINIRNGQPPYQILWGDGYSDSIRENLAPGSYQVSITDQAGCRADTTFALAAPPPLKVAVSGIVEGCNDAAIPLIRLDTVEGGTGTYFYSLNGGPFALIPGMPEEIGPLDSSGVHTLLIQDENLCRVEQFVNIPNSESFRLDLGPDRTIPLGDSLLLAPDVDFEPVRWAWNPSSGLSTPDSWISYVQPLESTVYTLQLETETGCLISDDIRITVDATSPAYLPNAFSPNGDGVNDLFTVYGSQAVDQVVQLEVYDRWGNQLFSRRQFPVNDPQFGWDGRTREKALSPGTYLYRAEIRLISGEILKISGGINLIR